MSAPSKVFLWSTVIDAYSLDSRPYVEKRGGKKWPPELFGLAGIAKQLDIDAIEAEVLEVAVEATNENTFPPEIGSLAQLATQKLLRSCSEVAQKLLRSSAMNRSLLNR